MIDNQIIPEANDLIETIKKMKAFYSLDYLYDEQNKHLTYECPVDGCKTINDLRGSIKNFDNCKELKAIFFCKSCRKYIEIEKLRFYRDGRIGSLVEGNWVNFTLSPRFKIELFFKNFINKFKGIFK
jgi:hypothetical protein